MGREWRRLALAALAAAAVAHAGVHAVEAQTAKTQQAKKAPQKAPDDEEEELKPQAAPKKKKVDAAEAQRSVEAAGKLIEAGKYDQAIQSLTGTLNGGGLPPATMAKAFFYRGLAYRQQQKPAQAISDIGSALWIKGGLSQADRSNAMQQRTAAYKEAGMSESGEPIVALQAPIETQTVRTKPPAETNWGTSTTATTTTPPAPTPEATPASKQVAQQQPSGGSWFNSWFNGGSSTQQQQQAPQQTAAFQTTTTKVQQPESKASSWTSATEVKAAPKEIETASIQPPAKPQGRFRVVVATVRTQDEAQNIAAKVRRDYAGSGEPDIDETVFGNMGKFYRVRVGPFASQQEGQAACARFKGSGLDCLVVAQ